ncbi:MAG: acetylxylan esterase [Kiritimatiellia bacterium]
MKDGSDLLFTGDDIYPRQRALFEQFASFWLRYVKDQYARRVRFWRRDYSSLEAYERSVDVNRQHFLEAIGGWPWERVALGTKREKLARLPGMTVERVEYSPLAGIETDAILLVPEGKGSFPAVLTPPGVNGVPETVCGFTDIGRDPSSSYHSIGSRLAAHGYVVLAPRMVTGFAEGQVRDQDHRAPTLMNPLQLEVRELLLSHYGKDVAKDYSGGTRARGYLDRISRTVGMTLMGTEMFCLSRCIDLLETLPEVARERIGMYGISQGGMSTLWLAALDRRIAAAVCGVYFNERYTKLILRTDHNFPFLLSCEEEHMYRLLDEFADSDIASLICPRPFAVEAGRKDDACWHEQVVVAFREIKAIYERLGVGERCVLLMHDGGHEVEPVAAVEQMRSVQFLDRWLKQQ